MEEGVHAALLAVTVHFKEVCSALLDVRSCEEIDRSLNTEHFNAVVEKFVSRSDVMAIYAEHRRDDKNDIIRFGLSADDAFNALSTLVFVKVRCGAIVPDAVPSQVSVLKIQGECDGVDREQFLLSVIQQHTKHTFLPVARIALSLHSSDAADVESLTTLQRKIRELDLALEHCQRSALVPRVKLPVPSILAEAASHSSAVDIRKHLDKYIATHVDSFFDEIGLSLSMGETESQRENFANDVNKYAKQWPHEIAKQTKLLNSPFPSSISKEVEFWKDFDIKLRESKLQLDTPEALLTKLVLKRTNRVSEGLIREAENELEKSISIVHGSYSFLRDFPIESVLASTAIFPGLSDATTKCLQHFTKIKYSGSGYDLGRAGELLDTLGLEVNSRLTVLLRESNMMKCSIRDFRIIFHDCEKFFRTWKQEFIVARNALVEMQKRRNVVLNFKTTPKHALLETRIVAISEFREQHEKLRSILRDILSDGDDAIVQDLEDSYKYFLPSNIDCLDTSEEGQTIWTETVDAYEKRLERLEDSISRLLGEQLRNSKSTDETFRLFSIFNPLFFRRAIWNAVSPFRVSLIKHVHEDIERLQEKFRLRYDESLEKATADLRDIPPLSGRILWARQIENQLNLLLNRMENVLGAGWQDQSEGKKLKEVCDELLNFLDIDSMFENWIGVVSSFVRDNANSETVVLVVKVNPTTSKHYIAVNYDIRLVQLFKEVRYLEWLLPSTSIPYSIKMPASEAYNRYPSASALQAALSTYYQAKKALDADMHMLVVTHEQAVRDLVQDAVMGSKIIGSKQYKKRMNWDRAGLVEWVEAFSRKVNRFEEKVEDVCAKVRNVNDLIDKLRVCAYDHSAMSSILQSVQEIVDAMHMRGFSNIDFWVAGIDKTIEKILLSRLYGGIKGWVQAFANDTSVWHPHEIEGRFTEPASEPVIQLDQTVHEILLSNQILYVSPPLEQARAEWIASFHQHICVCCSLQRIISSRFNVFSGASTKVEDYSNILDDIDTDTLRLPYIVVDEKVRAAKTYVQKWLQYQVLWDVPINGICDRVGHEISTWQKLLLGVKTARSTIESSSDEILFGPIVINFRHVQNKVNVKYDTWQKELQQHFASIVMDSLKELHSEFIHHKRELEGITLDGPTKDIIAGVELILKLKNSIDDKKDALLNLEQSERLLIKQRHQFSKDWLPASNTSGAFNDLVQILDRRVAAMDTQLPSLQAKILEEDCTLSGRLDDLISHWEIERPDSGETKPHDALQILSMYNSRTMKLKEDYLKTTSAKAALGLDISRDDRLDDIIQEVSDLREVWVCIMPIWEQLEEIRESDLKNVVLPKLRKQLDELTHNMNALPVKARSYPAFENLQLKISKYLSLQPALRDIISEALRERHWKVLLNLLNLKSTSFSELKLGQVWDSDLMSNRKSIADVLSVAQGEMALEQYIKDVREYWSTLRLNVILREDGIRLITEWTEVFTMLEDHLTALSSLKQSPYFRNVPEFQVDAVAWENKLTLLRSIFDIWIEVQRKWMYLHGIFSNADIKAQLPSQFTKFKGVDSEFTKIMKRVHAKPQIQEILGVDGLLSQLERQDSTMYIIQKALGEYLEKQRQIFPRFYFVNNDDLVEIIGNNNEPFKVFPHLSKMFAALTVVVTGDSNGGKLSKANGMGSKEGECVAFVNQLDLTQGVKEWLSKLETEMVLTIVAVLGKAIAVMPSNGVELLPWIEQYPAQVVILACQVRWCNEIENELLSGSSKTPLTTVLVRLEGNLKILSESVLQNMDPSVRKKCEQIITEIVHQRDVSRQLIKENVTEKSDFSWLYHLRFYWDDKSSSDTRKLSIRMSNAHFFYGFEYLGVSERLVQTQLTDRCYLTLTQALHLRMGGNPFGPAGTGKTESVKMLGSQLGRFVLVFNCDENFDYAAMGRIFAGLCQVGAWGCFDEFNRLEERILSAVSQQILTIQRGLMTRQEKIELLGVPCRLHSDVGIFVTMNPGYAGRSNLPDNLKQLFRAVAMAVPDRKMIAQVMLFSQGLTTAEELAGKIVLLFTLCEEQLSSQSHYDFGLRSLKSVLIGAGDLKRSAIQEASSSDISLDMHEVEKVVLIKSTCSSIMPKLVAEDIPLFTSLLQAVFPNTEVPSVSDKVLVEAVHSICVEDGIEYNDKWINKILQLKHVIDLRHGVMMVGPSCSGKTSVWRTLLKALGKVDGFKGDFYIIDPKSIKKDKLYGSLDANTLEWTDGIFTKILRKVADSNSVRAETFRRSWIVFDGDVDPEWAENLNSVLDDNKVLTLPSGDRLKLPPNIRILMEVDTLKHATLATVSRCGMVWFAENTISLDMMFRHQLNSLKNDSIHITDATSFIGEANAFVSHKEIQSKFVDALTPFFSEGGLVELALKYALSQQHVMSASSGRLLTSMHSMLQRAVAILLEYSESNPDTHLSDAFIELFANKHLLLSLLWGFGASLSWDKRCNLAGMLLNSCNISIPSQTATLLDYTVDVVTGEWVEWSKLVPHMEIESHKVVSTDVVVTTTDTVRHIEVLKAWLSSHKPLILCGPPGSGKTMTLTNVIDSMSEFILASLNFSSGTTPDLILKVFKQYCEVTDSPDGLLMQPNRQSYSEDKWLVIFCDEINLPQQDKYGTQRVIMFMRQLTEQGGFWNKDCKWVSLRRIQFVGACNPPTDTGRVSLSERFMRHAPLLLVDYPAKDSLTQIYHCFNHALLKLHPNLRGAVDNLTDAMVAFYMKNQERFTPDTAPQYIYSPRELSRWVRAMYEAMEPLEAMTLEELVRLWAHEALRLFHDRLISMEEKSWCNTELDRVAAEYFPAVDVAVCLQRPMLYSNWLSKRYQSVSRDELHEFVAARLKVFYEEELDVPLVIFDDVLEHVLRIDNVLRHPMGHLLLVGESGVGKTVLSRFVSWMNGLSIFQIKANNKYTLENFDEDLRSLLKRVGVDGEKVCFIFDESNALSSAFLERMNALLASGEVPGLFEGDDLAHLISSCQNTIIQREGSLSETEDELWRRFTRSVQRNLHVVFTMNPSSTDFSSRCTTSPALFNRCVVNWCGTWSRNALAQVGYEFTNQVDTGYTTYVCPDNPTELLLSVQESTLSTELGLHEAIAASLVGIHISVKNQTLKLGKVTGRQHYLSPRDFLDLIRKFVTVEQEKRVCLEDQQTHIRTGLTKLLETQTQVTTLRQEMVAKENVLREKDSEANLKLSQMVEKQNEAEQRKSIAEKLTAELTQQNEEIRVRKEAVESELSEAEPALQSAKQSVQNIRKAQLDEVRALARPPLAVQLTMEMVSIMIGEKSTEWAEIRKVIRRDDFISTVVNFNPMTLNSKQVKKVQEHLNNPELDYVSVDRASKACGPLYMWAQSQINYSTILRKIKPLRDEVESLEEKSKELLCKHSEAVAQVSDLEESITQYKAEYAKAIRDTETIRSEMMTVSKKVARAEALLNSLNEEKERWQTVSTSFDVQMSTLLGDCLLASAFLTYSGIFDHKTRRTLFHVWCDELESFGVPFQPDIDFTDYLSTPSDILQWKSYGLSTDDLAVQNCIILERFYRFPMVVDPSGQAVDFFMRKYSERRITKTSFLDSSFFKTLASAVRFGTPLLVEDVENLDPILNPVLNKEFQKTGGRTLVRIGSEDIDYSPQFLIILTSRNPQARFAPDLCSRVTMVNFTVTPASLEAQVLSKILHSERPDVDNRRTELQRVQSEQSVKLRELEEELLNKISAVQGAILDDDTLVNTLENIKAEAADLSREVHSTAEIMDEMKSISNLYEPLAVSMSSVFFTLERLADVSFLYQFSLQFFLTVVEDMLRRAGRNNSAQSEPMSRLRCLQRLFFEEISRRVLRSLKFEDKLLFVTRLAQICTQSDNSKVLNDSESDLLFRGISPIVHNNSLLERCKHCILDHQLTESTAKQLLSLSQLESFTALLDSMDSGTLEARRQWKEAYTSESPENIFPVDWIPSGTSIERVALLKIMLIRVLRPDRLMSTIENYVAITLGEDFKWREYSQFNLRELVEQDSSSSVPLMLCSDVGQDASAKVDSLASKLNKSLLQVAMGSAEGFSEAERIISQSSKSGSWVLLRNVHLCPDWLNALEKKLHGLAVHTDFRLFLTCEANSSLPTSLLRASDVIFVEASTGIKANIRKFLVSVEGSRVDRSPTERSRLYALLAWFNAVVQERLRYSPLGWTKRYEFSEADTMCAVNCIDEWVDIVAGKKMHISPTDIPWKALRVTLSQSLYGGRIDNPFDQAALDSFINTVFCPENYGANTAIASEVVASGDTSPLVTLPDRIGREYFYEWVDCLPDKNSPSWLGLPVTAENQLQSLMGQRILSHISVVQGVLDDAEHVSTTEGDVKPQLMSMCETLSIWLNALPGEDLIPVLDVALSYDVCSTPLERYLAREVHRGRSVLQKVRQDIHAVRSYCDGRVKATNYSRSLLHSFSKGLVPIQWKQQYITAQNISVGAWITDLANRCEQLRDYTAYFDQKSRISVRIPFWLGGMFSPEAFITATRQNTAQEYKWSLEELELYLDIGEEEVEGVHDTVISKLLLESAMWIPQDGLQLSSEIQCRLPASRLRWRRRCDRPHTEYMTLPVYMNEMRSSLVVEVLVPQPPNIPRYVWAQRGVGLIMQYFS